MVGTWLGEICSCSCLGLLPQFDSLRIQFLYLGQEYGGQTGWTGQTGQMGQILQCREGMKQKFKLRDGNVKSG